MENRFTYHSPTHDKIITHEAIREQAKNYAYFLDAVLPDSREKSLAITKLEEVVMWANASVARNE